MKAAYWIIAAAVTVAGIGLMAEGRRQMDKEVKARAATEEASQVTEHFASADRINVDLGSSEVRIISAKEAQDITVQVINPCNNLVLECKDNEVIIRQKAEIKIFDFDGVRKPMQTFITVPEDIDWEMIAVELGSGNLSEMRGMSVQSLSVDLGSGSATLHELEIHDNCWMHTGSGTFTADHCTVAGESWMESGSGNMVVSDCEFLENFGTHCGSGSLRLNNARIEGDMNTYFGSGNLKGENVEVRGQSNWDFGSGNASINGFYPAGGLYVDLGSGNVVLTLNGKEEDFGYDTVNLSGNVVIDGKKMKKVEDTSEDKPVICVGGGSGNVKIDFVQNS